MRSRLAAFGLVPLPSGNAAVTLSRADWTFTQDDNNEWPFSQLPERQGVSRSSSPRVAPVGPPASSRQELVERCRVARGAQARQAEHVLDGPQQPVVIVGDGRHDARQPLAGDQREDAAPAADIRGALVEGDDEQRVWPVRRREDLGRNARRKASPWAAAQSCMSLQRFGTTKAKLTPGSKLARGWMLSHWALPETNVKLIAGLCLRA